MSPKVNRTRASTTSGCDWAATRDVLSRGWIVVVIVVTLPVLDHVNVLKLQLQSILLPMNNPAILIARHHDGRARAFGFGELASGSHADLQLFHSSTDNWAIEVRLIERVLDAAPSRTPSVA